jgi:hypothetical protein
MLPRYPRPPSPPGAKKKMNLRIRHLAVSLPVRIPVNNFFRVHIISANIPPVIQHSIRLHNKSLHLSPYLKLLCPPAAGLAGTTHTDLLITPRHHLIISTQNSGQASTKPHSRLSPCRTHQMSPVNNYTADHLCSEGFSSLKFD